jgi:hypothetical protein
MDEFMMDERGKQMIERPAIRADGGSRSRPVAHLGFNMERACSHHSGVVCVRERTGIMEVEVGVNGEETEETEEGAMLLQLTEAKWLLRLSAIEVESEPMEEKLSLWTEVQVANLRVLHRAEG